MRLLRPRAFFFLGILAGAALALSCGGGGNSEDSVSVQLDWTPNTTHIGIDLAQAKGWYKEAGVKVNILPYTDVNPDVIVANGKADIGVSFSPSVIFSRAAGLDVVSVAAVLQTNMTEMAVLDSSEIKRPRDFDGKVYAGFGLPYEEPELKTVIQADGGRGQFTTATLSTAAYEALYARRADFTTVFVAWEGVEADIRGIKLRTFKFADYGVPDYHSVVLIAKGDALTKKAVTLQRFMEATRRGYEYAAKEPEAAARDFIAALPKGTFPEPDMIHRSNLLLVGAFLGPDGRWGMQDGGKWDAFSRYMLGQGIVTDAKQQTVREVPGPLFTNQFFTRTALLPR
jgi:ABC-type nitrate/sulfonate/bicarbonate transport system substrate-binding protein